MYSRQKNPLVDRLLLHSRTRFGNSPMASRQDGLKPVVREMRKGLPFYYLPDMDFGARDAVFVPFFGVPAATVTAMSRLAKITGPARPALERLDFTRPGVLPPSATPSAPET